MRKFNCFNKAGLAGKHGAKALLGAFCLDSGALTSLAHANTLEAVNHTHWAINRFSVDGRSGLDIIGPYQGGGGGCCYIAPADWRKNLTVLVEWETGASSMSPLADDFPGFADYPKYLVWSAEVEKQKRRHSKLIPVPDYTGQPICGLTVHFLPCDEVQVTTSCYSYGNPEYPIKLPLRLEEPEACPLPEAQVQGADQ